MLFDKIIGHKKIIERLKLSVDNNKISHAQMFSGPEGAGVLNVALAYAEYVLCLHKDNKETCSKKVSDLNHPDIHFVYPVNTNKVITRKPVSNDFITEWREFFSNNKSHYIQDWYEKIDISKKAGRIGVDEAQNMVKKMSLKSYEGGFKIMIIWMPELMNIPTANKILKLIEEPTGKTLFLFVTENEKDIIKTVYSRTQLVYFNRLADSEVRDFLISEYKNKIINLDMASDIALRSNGNLTTAISILHDDENENKFEELFVMWVRGSFKADIKVLIDWSNEMAKLGKQFQVNFLKYAARVFRQGLLENYEAKELSFLKVEAEGFSFDKFIKFVHGQNISDMLKELDLAIYHIERNGNAKIVLLDVSVKITRGLHTKYKV